MSTPITNTPTTTPRDREQPSESAGIPDDEPEDDVLEQRQEVPYGHDEDDR
jgi:hypothetical protein